MTRFAVDTSVLIPAALAARPRHTVAAQELEARLDDGQTMLLPVHAVLEAYSVMTRVPPPLRVEPKAAIALIQGFVASGELLSLYPAQYLEFLDSSATAGIAGGRIYDAMIATTARAANADVLLAYNVP